MLRIALTGLLPCLLYLNLSAQEAEIRGTVTGSGGDTLVGCAVRVLGSVIGDVTDLDGRYHLEVPPGRIRLVFSYIGYENYDTVVVVGVNDREFGVDVVLTEEFTEMGEVIVYGRRATGQAQALRLQQSAIAQQTIIHAELFNKYPDITLAETVQRMPGVTITRDDDRGQMVQVRGLPEQYTAIAMNGQRLPAVQPEADRVGSLDIIQSNLVDEVRVIKSRSADLDADAIGGTVDFRIRQPEEQFEVLLQGGVGRNLGFDDIRGLSTGVSQAAAVLNSELSDEQVYGLLAGSYFRHARGNRTFRYDYGEDGVTGERLFRARPIDTDRNTQQYGVVGAVELRPSIYNRLRLSYNYSATDEDVYVREANFNREGFAAGVRRSASRWQEERSLNMVALEAESNFDKTTLDYAISFASTSERVNDRIRIGATGTLNAAIGADAEAFRTLRPVDVAATGSLRRNYHQQLNFDLEEDAVIGGANLTRYLDADRRSFIRGGARLRFKERAYQQFRDRVFFPVDPPDVQPGEFPIVTDDELIEAEPDLNEGPNYAASERISSGYLMYINNWSARFSSSVGLRYERTELEYTLDDDRGEGGQSYNDWFPSLNLTYRTSRERQFRLAYYRAIARVPYALLVRHDGFSERPQTRLDAYSLSNPTAIPTYSRNVDLTYERYGRNDGLLTLGAYAKFLENPTVQTADFAFVDGYPALGFALDNTADARLLGAEIGFYQSLAFLNPALRFFNLNGNANFNSYRVADDAFAGGTLAQAPRRAGNLSLVYSNPNRRINVVVAGNYRSSTLDYLQEGRPVWANSVINLDVAADYELFRNISAYARLNNLTDHRQQRYLGKPDEEGSLPLSDTNFGIWGVVGLRWRP